MPKVKAVVLDSNEFPNARFSPGRIEAWVEAANTNGAVVWIPDVVIWELAEHLHRDFNANLAGYNAMKR